MMKSIGHSSIRRQIPVYYLLLMCMKIEKALSHILQNRSFQHKRNIRNTLKEIIQAFFQLFHHQHGQLTVGKEAQTKKLGDVGMAKARNQLTFLQILLSNFPDADISCIDKSFMYLLSCTHKSFDYNLK